MPNLGEAERFGPDGETEEDAQCDSDRPDGHCRAFDAEARGTVGGDAVVVVVLKRLEDAKSPDGRPMKMTLKPIKKLILKTTTKSANGNSSGSSESFIAEHEGKLVIPVPTSK